MAVTALSAQAQKATSTDTLIVTTEPQMHCSGCENRIKQNIRFVKGVKAITTSVADQKVTIVYQKNKATYDDFGKAFGKIGFRISRYTCTPQKK